VFDIFWRTVCKIRGAVPELNDDSKIEGLRHRSGSLINTAYAYLSLVLSDV